MPLNYAYCFSIDLSVELSYIPVDTLYTLTNIVGKSAHLFE